MRITIHHTEETVEMILEGRVAGPWVLELSRAWTETAQQLQGRPLTIDLRNVTYADSKGKDALRQIVGQVSPHVITGTLWTQYLAEEISSDRGITTKQEAAHGTHA